MNYNQALMNNALLSDLRELKGPPAKAMTEILLLRVHYGKIAEEFQQANNKINEDADADDDAKAKAREEKLKEEISLPEKRMTQTAFEQVVESAMHNETIKSWLFVKEGDDDKDVDRRAEIPVEQWLAIFAGNMVEG